MENMEKEKSSIKVSYKDGAAAALLMDEEILDEAAIKRLSEIYANNGAVMASTQNISLPFQMATLEEYNIRSRRNDVYVAS